MREKLKAGRKAAGMTQQQMADQLEQLAASLVEYLRKNFHPHTAIVVTDERVAVVEDVLGIPFWNAGIPKIPTCELVNELKGREGVETHVIGPAASIKVQTDEPATVLSVID